ncbi:hypothetical protein J5N97_010369 [Dioscorea zingiberensis]|uniref:BHLH domain-containing protein n=1 Tax=Dioscorea zingiberensis TaxID=325984 RepID=A0A9D5HME6_9LILI|nr:hypothetical protein J5N97_010369 [Dioscorea zingiberensis]
MAVEESDLMSQLMLSDHHSMFWSDHEAEMNANLSSCFLSQENSSNYNNYFMSFSSSAEDQVFQNVHNHQLQELFTGDFSHSGAKRKVCISEYEDGTHTENLEKKHWIATEKKSSSKKLQKSKSVDEFEESNVAMNGQSSSSYSSEDDSNASQELNRGNFSTKCSDAEIKLKGKTRASRGTSTEPQSLYARKRRERINERLRILQKLVPNGTKVDISTMLEEAVQYVKFLQLQIKLLSSDELWMYAPIAYNGMDIGLDFKNSQPQR